MKGIPLYLLMKKDYDYEVEPRPNRKCKDCYGRGIIKIHINDDTGWQRHPCHCIRYYRTDTGVKVKWVNPQEGEEDASSES